MRKLVYGLILAFAVSLFPAAAQADTISDEATFVSKINDLRVSKGLPALQVHPNLVDKSRAWSATMAAAGKIWHSTLSDGITADWKKLGENVGMGGSVDGLHDAFVASPHHYENLVDPAFGYIGIGVVRSGNTIFVTESFMQLMPTKTAPVVTSTTTTAPKPTTTTTAKPAAPKPVVAAKPKPTAPPSSTTTTTAAPTPAPVAAPAEAAAPVDPPRAPSPLLVSVLERLRTFDS